MRTISRRWLLTATLLYGLAAAAMFALLLPETQRVCGQPPLDVRFGWSRQDALGLVQACGPEGLGAYSRMALLDLAYPALVAWCLILWVRWSQPTRSWAATVVQGIIASGAVADYLENCVVWTLLSQGADADSSPLLVIGGVITATKTVLISLGLLGTGLLVARAVVQRIRAPRIRT